MDIELITKGLQEVLTSYKGGLLLGCSTLVFFLVKLLRGQAGMNVPFLTEFFEKQKKGAKTGIILGICGLSGVLTTLTTATAPVVVWDILNGLISGLSMGATVLGIRQVYKQATGTDVPPQDPPTAQVL
jgi:hypothetical protein